MLMVFVISISAPSNYKTDEVLISYVVAIVVFTFLSVSTVKLHLLVEQEQLTLSEL